MTGTELRVALAGLDLQQKRLAEMTGCRPEAVSRWVGGQLAVPVYVDTIIRLLQQHNGTQANA